MSHPTSPTHSGTFGSAHTALVHTKDAGDAAERGWDLYQLDGFWYVNDAKGVRRQPRSHVQPPPEAELAAEPTMADAMAQAVKEWDRREGERTAAAAEAKRVADAAARAHPAPLTPGQVAGTEPLPIGAAGRP